MFSVTKHGKAKLIKGFRSYRVRPSADTETIEHFLSALDCPRSLAVWIMFKYDEHDQITSLEFDPLHYASAEEVKRAYFATCYLSKYKGLTLKVDPKQEALRKFEEFELLCKHTNQRFRHLSSDPLFSGPTVWLHNAVIRKIERILGAFSPDEFVRSPDWGPGASTTIRRRDASAARKFQIETGITRQLHALLPLNVFQKFSELWWHQLGLAGYPSIQEGNKVTTVPKSAKIDRVIAIEPGLNLFFQKSIGNMIRRRLKRCGINLNNQSINQQLARGGSLTGSVATVDMSSASDSISRKVIEELVPPQWLSVMDVCRSHCGALNDQLFGWNKFSSMGNGFTFELESLIFYAMASAIVEYYKPTDSSTVSVYGDDVILPTSCFRYFVELAAFYGFRINEKKSHFNSPFRESCGAHYYSGFDLKPVYLKDKLTTVPSVYRLANSYRRLAHRQMATFGCDARYRNCFEHLIHLVPRALRLRIPEGLGDGGFISCFDEATPMGARKRPSGFLEGYRVRQLQDTARRREEVGVGYALANYWLMSKRDNRSSDVPEGASPRLKAIARLTELDRAGEGRNAVPLHDTFLKLGWSLVPQWYDLGPWI